MKNDKFSMYCFTVAQQIFCILPHFFLVSDVALIIWLRFCGARMHHDSMYGMESEHGTLILPYQLHVGLSCSTLYNTRTMVGFFFVHYII